MSTALYEGAIRTCSVVDASSFVEHLFPDELIFDLKNAKNMVSKSWDAFRTANPHAWTDLMGALSERNSEEDMVIFLKLLIGSVGLGRSRSWSAANRDKSAGGDAARKPDLVCYDTIMSNDNDWSHFMSVGELKSGDFKGVYDLLVERATLLFRNQDCRRFVLTFVLVKHSMTVALFDRGGSIVTEAFDIEQLPLLLVRFILGLTFAPLASLGYDTTITTHRAGRTLSSTYIPNIHLICVLYVAERTHGRGTVVWLAKIKDLPTDQVPEFIRNHFGKNLLVDPAIIIKDIWTDENTSLTEGMILALLKAKGVKGVPHILAEERVRSIHEKSVEALSKEVPEPSKIPASAQPDSTTLIRSRLNLPEFKLCPKALKSAQQTSETLVSGFEARAHVRSYMTPWAIPIFHFRSGVELLGAMVDALTAHEQAASSHFVMKPDVLFPFRFLHRDPSILNIGMIPAHDSDFPPCPLRSKGECRGLLYDWGFAKVAAVEGYEGFQEMDVDTDDDEDANMEDMHTSSDTDVAPRSIIHVPSEDCADSGLYTATPDIINDFNMLVRLVCHCIREEQPALEITGTRPFMAIELLVTSFVHTGEKHPWRENFEDTKHEVRHDLEAFYMVLVSLCLLYERPHARKGLNDYLTPGAPLLPEEDILPFCAVLWLTGQEEQVISNIRLRYLTLCTSQGFATMVVPYLSNYFAPMAPYLEQIRALLYGRSEWSSGPYKRPDTCPTYEAFQAILLNAMKTIPATVNGVRFSTIVEPPPTLYCPISPEGQWQGKPWMWDKPFPIWSNNAFGFVEDQLPSQLCPSTCTTEGYIKVPALSSVPKSREPVALKTKGRQVTARYAMLPEVERGISERIRHIKGSSLACKKSFKKPYNVYSPSKLRRRRSKWLNKAKGKEG